MIAFGELLVLFVLVVFEVLPGNNYKKHIHQIQLVISMIGTAIVLIDILVMYFNPQLVWATNDLMDIEAFKYILFIHVIILVSSAYKYRSIIKNGNSNVEFTLKKEEYTLSNEFDFSFGNVSIPNIKRVAICNDFIIIFGGRAPTREVDAKYICRKIGEKQYECLSFETLDEKTIWDILSQIGTVSLVIIFSILPILFVGYGHKWSNPDIRTFIGNINTHLFLVGFGLITIKLFKSVNGITKYIFLLFGFMVIVVSILSIFV